MADKQATLLIRIKQAGQEALSNLNLKTLALGAAVAVLAKKLFDLGVQSFEAFAKQESATNMLNQSLVQQGIYTAQLSKQYHDLATELQRKTLYGDEEIIQGQAILQSYLGQTKVSRELLMATLDLAAAKGKDLKSAAELVGKSIGSSTNALQREGIEIDTTASKTDKLAAVIQGITGKMGGQAAAAAEGTGAWKQMQNAVGDLYELIGQALAPIIVMIAQKVRDMAYAVAEATWFWNGLHYAMYGISATFSVVQTIITTVVGALMQTFQSLAAVWIAIANGEFSKIPGIIGDHWVKMKDRVVNNVDKMINEVAASYEKQMAYMNGQFRKEEDLLRMNEERKLGIKRESAAAQLAEQQKLHDEEQKKRQEAFEKEQADFQMKSEQDMMRMEVERQIRADADALAKFEELNRQIAFETERTAIIAAEEQKRLFLKKYYDAEQAKLDKKKAEDKKALEEKEKAEKWARMDATEKFEAFMDDKRMRRATATMGYMTQMQDSKSRELVAIGKAAAVAQIITQTAAAVMNIWGWASAIPFVGPALAAGLTAAVVAYGAEQIGRVGSAQMAEGGIVTARPGGMLATIGEGGRDEAVIPLEDGRVPGMEGNTTINLTVNGGLLGDEASAYELARALDRQFRRLEESGDRISG